MRAFDCADGTHLHGQTDEQVFREARRHADEVHAAEGYTNAQLRKWIEDGGYRDTDHEPKKRGSVVDSPASVPGAWVNSTWNFIAGPDPVLITIAAPATGAVIDRVSLNLSAVPEPSALLTLSAGAGLTGWLARRRRPNRRS